MNDFPHPRYMQWNGRSLVCVRVCCWSCDSYNTHIHTQRFVTEWFTPLVSLSLSLYLGGTHRSPLPSLSFSLSLSPVSPSISLCLSMSLSVSVFLCVSVCLCFSVSAYVSLSVSVSLSLPMSLSLPLSHMYTPSSIPFLSVSSP